MTMNSDIVNTAEGWGLRFYLPIRRGHVSMRFVTITASTPPFKLVSSQLPTCWCTANLHLKHTQSSWYCAHNLRCCSRPYCTHCSISGFAHSCPGLWRHCSHRQGVASRCDWHQVTCLKSGFRWRIQCIRTCTYMYTFYIVLIIHVHRVWERFSETIMIQGNSLIND